MKKLFKFIIKFIKDVFTKAKEFWVKEFPDCFHDECFMCNEISSCAGCLYL